MKSVISNTSDSGCGGREREKQWAGRPPRRRAQGRRGGNTHFAVRRHLALLPGHPPAALRRRAQRLTGKRRRAVRAVPARGRWPPPQGPSRPVSIPARLPSAAAEPPRPPGALPLRPAAGGDAPAGSSRARGWPKRLTGAAEETPAGPVTSRRCQAEAWVAPSGSPAPSARGGKRSALPAGSPCAGVPGRDWCRGLSPWGRLCRVPADVRVIPPFSVSRELRCPSGPAFPVQPKTKRAAPHLSPVQPCSRVPGDGVPVLLAFSKPVPFKTLSTQPEPGYTSFIFSSLSFILSPPLAQSAT